MRFVDIAVAGAIGLSSIAVMVALSPQPDVAMSQQLLEEVSLRNALLQYVSGRGLPWLQEASDRQICSSVAVASNSTFSMSATIGTVPCGPVPQGVHATLTIHLPSRLVVLEAWYSAQG